MLRLGLCSAVFPDACCWSATLEHARQVASGAPLAQRFHKIALADGGHASLRGRAALGGAGAAGHAGHGGPAGGPAAARPSARPSSPAPEPTPAHHGAPRLPGPFAFPLRTGPERRGAPCEDATSPAERVNARRPHPVDNAVDEVGTRAACPCGRPPTGLWARPVALRTRPLTCGTRARAVEREKSVRSGLPVPVGAGRGRPFQGHSGGARATGCGRRRRRAAPRRPRPDVAQERPPGGVPSGPSRAQTAGPPPRARPRRPRPASRRGPCRGRAARRPQSEAPPEVRATRRLGRRGPRRRQQVGVRPQRVPRRHAAALGDQRPQRGGHRAAGAAAAAARRGWRRSARPAAGRAAAAERLAQGRGGRAACPQPRRRRPGRPTPPPAPARSPGGPAPPAGLGWAPSRTAPRPWPAAWTPGRWGRSSRRRARSRPDPPRCRVRRRPRRRTGAP
jgi:hypothetical protein